MGMKLENGYETKTTFWEDFTNWMNDEKEGFAAVFRQKCKDRKIDLENLGKTNEQTTTKKKESSPPPPATSVTGTGNDVGRTAIPQRNPNRFNYNYGIGSRNSSSSALQRQLDALDRQRSDYEREHRYKG